MMLSSSAVLLALLGCSTPTRTRVEPSFVNVAITSGEVGTPDAPVPFTSAPVSYGITVTTTDYNGDAYPMNGDLTLQVRPGTLAQDSLITLANGTWSGSVLFQDGFGPTRIWATDEGDRDQKSTRPASYAAGVSEAINFDFPTIAEMQATTNTETNNLMGEFAELRIADRQVVVIARDAAGFWAQDIMDPPASGASVYVYTFSRPDDTLAVGAQLSMLNGIDEEYLASTQFSYPTTGVTGATLAVPAAVNLTACDDTNMELVEGARVAVNNGTIPATFIDGSQDYSDYLTYGQWPIAFGACTLYVESSSTVPDYHPTDHVGETVGYVSGMVKQIYSKWVIVVEDPSDIGDAAPAPAPQPPARTGAQKAATRQYYPEFP